MTPKTCNINSSKRSKTSFLTKDFTQWSAKYIEVITNENNSGTKSINTLYCGVTPNCIQSASYVCRPFLTHYQGLSIRGSHKYTAMFI